MRTRIQRWGNSLAVRVPIAFVKELSLSHNDPIDISLEGKRVILTPLLNPEFTLDELLTDIDTANAHRGEGMIDYMKEIKT